MVLNKYSKSIWTLAFIFCSICIYGQDHLTWSSFQVEKKIDDKWAVFVKPIYRYNFTQSSYLNWSPDYAVKYKLNKTWSMMLLGRTWFVPDAPNRQFVFFDINHGHKVGKFVLRNKLRMHYAPDVQREDADFVRWHPALTYSGIKKIEPIIGFQFFQRLNGINKMQRIRYAAGFKWPISSKLNFFFQYWNEVDMNSDNDGRRNIYVCNLLYKF